MEMELARLIGEHWPGMMVFAALLFGVLLCVRFLALTSESVSRALGPVGKFFRDRRAINKAESNDMRRQIITLDRRVRALLYRDECYFAYMVVDAEWHRRHELNAIANGWEPEPHVPFLKFRDQWMRERGLEKDSDIWT